MSQSFNPDLERALTALAIARREGISLEEAAGRAGTTPQVVLQHAGVGWEQRGDRWIPTSHDSIPRQMTVLGPDGPVWVELRDSRTSTLVAQHHNAVRHYIETGDTSWLEAFRGRSVRARDGPRVELVTDPSSSTASPKAPNSPTTSTCVSRSP